jgi:hypothetical protein
VATPLFSEWAGSWQAAARSARERRVRFVFILGALVRVTPITLL